MSEDTDGVFRETVAEAFEARFGASEGTAGEAADRAAAFREDWAADLTAEALLDALAHADYDDFEHRYDHAIGDLAAGIEDCTDSRPYRLAGFDDHAADPDVGA
jgi:hypothetical protein